MNEILKSIILTPFNFLYKINPELELKILFNLKTGRKLDLVEPKGFNEKVNWLKLYDKDERRPLLSDKYTVRDYVEKITGDKILNKLYWHGENPEDIPFDELPNQFVIKVTHGSTFTIICNDKEKLTRDEAVKQLKIWLKAKFIPCYGEWWYGLVKPQVIVEKYLENPEKNELLDYKVFCFNGEPKLIDVHTGRFGVHRRNVYDTKWDFLEDVSFKYPQSDAIEKPVVLQELLEYARMLSKGFAHVRIDFFIVNNQIYFSEFTFANGAGFDKITPYSFDLLMGEWLELPEL